MKAAPNDAPIKVRVGFHVHLYLGVAVFMLSAIPFFSVLFLSGGFNASTDALVGAIVAVAVLHMALAFATRRCSTEKLKYWDGMRLITAYMTFGIGGSAMVIATPTAILGLVASIGIATMSLAKPQSNWAPHHFQRMIAFFYRHRMYQ
jgi:hypothetical protein